MTTPRKFTKNIGWERDNNKKYPREFFASTLITHCWTGTLQHLSKKLNPLQASLFDLLTTTILTDIKIWVFGLENCDRFKPVVLRFKTMCNLILFATNHGLWNPYHNFGVLSWYNEEHWEWVHRHIFAKYTGPWTRYKYYANKPTYITRLTPDIVKYLDLSKKFQRSTRDENFSILYLKQKIPGYDEENNIEQNEPHFPWPQPRWTCCPGISVMSYYYYFITTKFLSMLHSLSPASPSCLIVKDSFTQNVTTVITHFYVLC